MADPLLPLIVEPDALLARLHENSLLIVDLCQPNTYRQYHIPGAVYMDYSDLIRIAKPAMGMMPFDDHLNEVFSEIGLTADSHVVAYDDEGGGKAGRLLWTLDAIGHQRFSLLNGGLYAWAAADGPMSNETPPVKSGDYQVSQHNINAVADKDYILSHLNDTNTRLLDSRSPDEFSGELKLAERGGHIPGAVNMDWTMAMDRNNNLRLLPEDNLRVLLDQRGITADKEIIVYCQTHHRSSHTYIMLKALGFDNVRGYPGAWSEWGNTENLPVE